MQDTRVWQCFSLKMTFSLWRCSQKLLPSIFSVRARSTRGGRGAKGGRCLGVIDPSKILNPAIEPEGRVVKRLDTGDAAADAAGCHHVTIP